MNNVTRQWWRETVEESGIPVISPEDQAVELPGGEGEGEGTAIEGETGTLTGDPADTTPEIDTVKIPPEIITPESVAELFPAVEVTQAVEARLDSVAAVSVVVENVPADAQPVVETGALLSKSLGNPFENMDIAADYAYFQTEMGITENIEDADQNFAELDVLGAAQLGAPNGISDLAELLLLQHVLQSDELDLSSQGGVSQASAAARWQAVEDSFALAPGTNTVDARLKRVVTAFCVLGDYTSVFYGMIAGAALGWVPEDAEAQAGLLASPPWLFSAWGDADGDGFGNRLEWQATADNGEGEPETFASRTSAYFTGALGSSTQPSGTFYTVTWTRSRDGLLPYALQEKYKAGETVSLPAVPQDPWLLARWEVTPSGGTMQTSTANPLSTTVNGDFAAHAVFGPNSQAQLSFNDQRLEQAVRVTLHKLAGPLLWGDVLNGNLTSLDAHGLGIEDLGGIEYLVELESLNLFDNKIDDITPLARLSSLNALNLGINQIANLAPLAALVNLESLDLGRGDIFEGDVFNLPGQGNLITNIGALAALTGLKTLNLSGNNISDVSVLSSLDELMVLMLDGNPVQDFTPLQGLQDLMALCLRDTGFTNSHMSLFANWPGLIGVDLSENPITTLSGLAVCPDMQLLVCMDNTALSDISALASLPELKILLLTNTLVTGLAPLVTSTMNEGSIILKGNPLVPSVVCPQIESLELLDNWVDYDESCDANAKLLTITVTPSGSGSVEPFTGTHNVSGDTTVTLRAVQTNPQYVFTGWQGDATGTDRETSVVMTAPRSVTAVFAQGNSTLTMLEPVGAGTVEPQSPAVWACLEGEQRCLNAEGKPGWAFVRWVDENGATLSEDAEYCLNMTVNRTVQAVFQPADVTLSLSYSGMGTIRPRTGTHYYLYNDPVTLQATPAEGWFFNYWDGGGLHSVDQLTSITMLQDMFVSASFGQYDCFLTVNVTGQGAVSPGAGTHYHMFDDEVRFSVTPAAGWMFDHWEGDLTGAGGLWTPSLIMDASHAVTAVFVQIPHTVVPFPDANLCQAVRDAINKPTGDIHMDDLVGVGFSVLEADGLQIASLEGLQYCRDLTVLNLGGNTGITDLSQIGQLPNLAGVVLDGTRPLSLVPLQQLAALKKLHLSGCALADMSALGGMAGIEELYLDGNPLSGVAPIAGMTGLKIIDISGSSVSDLSPFAGLAALDQFIANNAAVSDLAVFMVNDGLTSGDLISVLDNPLGQDALCAQIPGFLSRGILVEYEGECRYNLDVQVQGTGTVTKSPDTASYLPGTVVTLEAVPGEHNHFDHWLFDAAGTASPATVVMDGNKSVAAVFETDRYLVTASAAQGGWVTLANAENQSGPGATASIEVRHGGAYAAYAQPLSGHRFVEWRSGGMSGPVLGQSPYLGVDPCESTASLFALFVPRHTLFVLPCSNGHVEGGTGNTQYDGGTELVLTAVPDPNYHFAGWTSDLAGVAANPTVLAMTQDRWVGALFEINMHRITVAEGQGGQVRLYANGSPEPLPHAAWYDLPHGTMLRVVAVPDVSPETGVYHRFSGWTGAPVTPEEPGILVFPVSQELSLSCAFQKQHPVTLEVQGCGNARLAPASSPQTELLAVGAVDGTAVQTENVLVDEGAVLTAAAAVTTQAGWRFIHWTVDGQQDTASPEKTLPSLSGAVTLRAVFAMEYEFILNIDPPRMVMTDPNSPPPGEVDKECDSPTVCTTFTLSARNTQNHWRFARWSEGESYVYRRNPLLIVLTKNRELTAEYEQFYLPNDLNTFMQYITVFDTEDVDQHQIGGAFHTTTAAYSVDESGHTIPEVVYMAIVDYMINGGGSALNQQVADAYRNNLDVLHAWFDALEDSTSDYVRPEESVISAVAAGAVYSTGSYAVLFPALRCQEKADHPNLPALNNALFDSPEFGDSDGQLRCVAELAPGADADADGFMNVEEWLFADWYVSALDPLLDIKSYENWTGYIDMIKYYILYYYGMIANNSDNIPMLNGSGELPAGSPPMVTLSIAHEGIGITTPPQGTYRLPKYSILDYPPNGTNIDCSDCPFNEVTVTAEDAPPWQFDNFRIEYIYNLTNNITDTTPTEGVIDTNSITCLTVADSDLVAAFENNADIFSKDLLNAYKNYMCHIGESNSSTNVYDIMFDIGGYDHDINGNTVTNGNGIPDIAEIALLNSVLHNNTLSLSWCGGLDSRIVKDTFLMNYSEADELMTLLPDYVKIVVAIYMTIGGYGHQLWIEDSIYANYGVELKEGYFGSVCGEYLTSDGNSDGDSYSNFEEWIFVNNAPIGQGGISYASDTNEGKITKYALSATNPTIPASTEGEGEGEGEEPVEMCSLLNATPTYIINGSNTNMQAFALEDVRRELSSTDAVKQGIVIDVEADKNPWFKNIIAPGTLLHECPIPRGSFVQTKRPIDPTVASAQEISVSENVMGTISLPIDNSNIWPEEYIINVPVVLAGAFGLPPSSSSYTEVTYVDPITNVSYSRNELLTFSTLSGYDIRLSASYNGGHDKGKYKMGWVVDDAFSLLSTPVIKMGATPIACGMYNTETIVDEYPFKTYSHSISAGNGRGYVGVRAPLSTNNPSAAFKGIARDYSFGDGYAKSVVYDGVPLPGYQVHSITDPVNGTRYGAHAEFVATDSSNVTVNFEKMGKLTLLTKIEGGSDCKVGGVVAASPASYYYSRPVKFKQTDGNWVKIDGSIVKLTAQALPGHKFDHWEGDGICWTSDEYIRDESLVNSIQRAKHCKTLTPKNDLFSSNFIANEPEIWIEMNYKKYYNDNKGRYMGGDRTITAVFKRQCELRLYIHASQFLTCPEVYETGGGHAWWQLSMEMATEEALSIKSKPYEIKWIGHDLYNMYYYERDINDVSLVNLSMGFYPGAKIGIYYSIFNTPGYINFYEDNNFATHCFSFEIPYSSLISGLNYVKALADNEIFYRLCQYNCTNMAIDVASSVGRSVDPGTSYFVPCSTSDAGARCPSELAQFLLNHEEAESCMP